MEACGSGSPEFLLGRWPPSTDGSSDKEKQQTYQDATNITTEE